MTALNPGSFRAGPLVFYGMSVLCATIAIACFFPQTHPITLRIIGTTIFVAYVVYAVDSFGSKNFGRALLGFAIWGLPSGYLAIAGKYPSWGTGTQAFNSKSNDKRK
jgi:hypothetical protein